jgi:hypothetical protein
MSDFPNCAGGWVDSQTTKSTGVGGRQWEYNGNKRVRGRKRHLLVDTEGLVLRLRHRSDLCKIFHSKFVECTLETV